MIRVKKLIQSAFCGLLLGAAVLSSAVSAQAQTAPRYVISQTIPLAVPAGFGNQIGNIASDKFGNVYVSDEFGTQSVYEFPADGSAPIIVFSGATGFPGGVAVDSAGALYVTFVYHLTSATDSAIYRLPPSATGIQPYVFGGTAPPACTAGATTVCTYGDFIQTAGYYYFSQSLAFDASGNGYLIVSGGGIGANVILACNVACGADMANATIALQGLPTAPQSIAATASGDLYWSDGTSIYYSKAGSSSFSVFDSTLGSATGVGLDRAGNLYAASYNGTFEYPAVGGVLASSSRFQISNQYAIAGPAIGNNGDVFDAQAGGVVKTALFNTNAGSSPVGIAANTITLTVSFVSPGTIASVAASSSNGTSSEFVVSGDTCTGVAESIGNTCTFNVTFQPTAVGLRRGTVILTDSTGNTVAQYIAGIGTGTGITIDPGTPSTITTALTQPSGMAIDSAKTLYVTDAGAGSVTSFASGATTGTVIATGLKSPTGIALDGAGNLFVVEKTGNDVLVYSRSTSSTTGFVASPAVYTSGLTSPTDVVVAGLGQLFVSNTGAHEVRQYPNSSRIPSLTEYSSYGSSLIAPAGLAVDRQGDLFVADTSSNQVVEITVNGVQTSLGSGLSAPTGVAVEPSGSVLIADQGNGRLIRVPNENGNLVTADQVVLPQPVVNPYAVRLASDGTLFISDNQASLVDSLSRTNGTVDFGITNVNTTSAAQSIIVSSEGTDAITLGAPFYAAVPASSSFALAPGVVGMPCNSGTLNAGSDCSLSATFAPTSTGSKTYAVPLNATAANTASPSITLTGRGVQLIAVNISVAQSPAGAVSYGVPIILMATVSSVGASTTTPTGNLTFTIDGNAYKASALVNGKASLTLSSLTTGTHTVVASYAGDATYASGVFTAPSIIVNPASTSGALTISASGVNPLSASVSDSVSFTTTITPSVAGTLSGTVTYYNGSTILGTVSVHQTQAPSAAYPTGQYAAIYSFVPTPTSPTPVGVYQVYAVFVPTANYTGFTTASQTLTIVSSPTYGITADTHTLTASAGQYGIANLTVSSYAGFQAGVSLTCSGLPANAYCIFRPVSVSLASIGTSIPPQTTQMQVRVDQNPVNILSASGFGAIGGVLALMLLTILRRKAPLKNIVGCTLAAGLLSFALTLATGCGSTSNQYLTPAGTYTIKLQSTATPLINGAAPTLYSIARIQVSGGSAHIITTAPSAFVAGSVIQITGSPNAAFNGVFTLTGTSIDTIPGDPYLNSTQLDFAAGSIANGTTANGGSLRQANVTQPDQTFTLKVQ